MVESDEWPALGRRLIDNGHLQAIGQMATLFNQLEEAVSYMFSVVFPTSIDFSEELFHSMNNRKRVDLLRAINEHNEKDPAVKDRIRFCLLCFDVCTDNRNILMHALTEVTRDASILSFSKRAHNDASRLVRYEVPLVDLRRVADECGDTLVFSIQITQFLMDRAVIARGQPPRTSKQRPLPDTPPQPRKLSPYQPPADPPADARPPGSSGG
jgi:hypothetical protein